MKSLILLGFAVFAVFQGLAEAKRRPRWMSKEMLDKVKDFANDYKKKYPKGLSQDDFPGKNGSMLRVDKKAGRIIVLRQMKLLEVKVKAITERAENGTLVKDVALKELTCKITKSSTGEDSTYTAKSISVELNCTLPNKANAALKIFMFQEAGNITGEDGNEYEVSNGAVKINLNIDNWPTEAKVIDVTFGMKCGLDVLKGKGRVPKRILKKLARRGANKAANRRGPESFGVCPEARGTFAANFKKDGVDVDMPEGYPKAKEDSLDNEAEIVLRFNGKNIIYDPVMEVGADVEEEENGGESGSAITSTPNVLMMLAILVFLQAKLF